MRRIQLKNKPENLEQREARLSNLALHTRTALEGMTVNELRELAAFLIPSLHKLKKSELVDAILEISEPYKAERLKQTVAAMELMGELEFTPDIINEGFTSGLTPEQVSSILISKYESLNYSASTIAKTKMKQLRTVLESLTLKNSEVKPWCDELYEFMRKYASKFHREANVEYSHTVENYGTPEQLITVSGKKILDWATEVIDWAYEQPNLDKGWHKVSFALALTSGRRQDEIHGHTQYKALDENTLEATGLAKKREEDFSHKSPCLVNAYKWLDVINKLPEKRRNQDNSVVNGVIRKAIEESIGDKIKELGLSKYKDSRDFYVSYLIARDYNKAIHGSEINFAKGLLAHESKKQTLSYEKMNVLL